MISSHSSVHIGLLIGIHNVDQPTCVVKYTPYIDLITVFAILENTLTVEIEVSSLLAFFSPATHTTSFRLYRIDFTVLHQEYTAQSMPDRTGRILSGLR